MDGFLWFVLILFVVVFAFYGIRDIKKLVDASKKKKAQVEKRKIDATQRYDDNSMNWEKSSYGKFQRELRRNSGSSIDPTSQTEKITVKSLDLSTEDGIDSVPNCYFEFEEKSIYDLLQSAAKLHKKNGEFSLCTQCLHKMNKIVFNDDRPLPRKYIDAYWKDLYEQRRFAEADAEKSKADSFFRSQCQKRAAEEYRKMKKYPYTYYFNPSCPKCRPLSGNIYCSDFRNPTINKYHNLRGLCAEPPVHKECAALLYCDFCDNFLYLREAFTPADRNTPELDDANEKKGVDLINTKVCEREYDWINRNIPDIKPRYLKTYMRLKAEGSEKYCIIKDTAESMGYVFKEWYTEWCDAWLEEMDLEEFDTELEPSQYPKYMKNIC
ncbi:MAG: hypothetical protein IJX47_03825 [Clostridia bacterium]|nr:hypothetical protein [Clostridia bacterium]